ncbi:cell division control protein 6 homolog [Ischnura elegans]|uniref:cell division control protein 6 homolog n=1 Tax=Ischnura elegans TaxID=197161 RepID=UPI001ED86822|nr:cell division control protein 6 homolog [Ischnura elegans]
MSLSQSKIKFNVRKKRNCLKTVDSHEKSENFSRKADEISRKVKDLPTINSVDTDSTSDSDVENVAETITYSSSGRKIKRKSSLYPSEISEGVCSPKRNRKVATGDKVSSVDVHLGSRLTLEEQRDGESKGIKTCIKDSNLKPKKLFVDDQVSKYRAARIALGASSSCEAGDSLNGCGALIGRKEQFCRLLSILHSCIDDGSTTSVYVSGPPGTGKTASLCQIMEDVKVRDSFKCIYVNCTSMKTASSIYSHVARALDPKASARNEKEWMAKVESMVSRSRRRILIVLDEMDQLLVGGGARKGSHQDVLYSVFSWPHLPDSRISLVGVANALDLTSRALPWLHATHPPTLIHFPPYTREEIHEILLHRLTKAGVGEVFSAPALTMLASKVASVSGDVRRALDVGRRVVQLVGDRDSSARKSIPSVKASILKPTSDDGTNSRSPRKRSGGSVVELHEVLSVLNGVYSTSQSLVSSSSKDSAAKENGLPVQQKVLLCCLILLVKKGLKGKPITIGRLHEVYSRACKRRNITPLDQSEFHSLCTLVETRGIIRLQSNKEARLSKVSLQWDEEEVGAALMDQHMLASILNDTSLLSR